MKKRTFLALAAALTVAPVWAQPSSKPVRIIVTFTAGGPVDSMARTIAEPLAKALGRTVIVENKPGGNGAIGAAEVIRSDPDGTVIWMSSVGAVAINQSLYPSLAYNMQRDFVPVSLVANNVELFVVNPKETARDASEFVAQFKARNASPPIASSGKGSIPHLALAQLEQAANAELLHIPYNGMAPALADLMGGQVVGVFADVPAVMNHVRSGKLKALGIAAPRRHPLLPDVKTFQEQGFPSVDTNNWYAMFVSARTPPDVVQQLNKAVLAAVADPAANAKIVQSGAEPKSSTPQELATLLRADTDKWAQLIKARNIKAE